MHYKNGREAKNGDKVVWIPIYNGNVNGPIRSGILYDAKAGNDFCNGSLAPCRNDDPCPNLAECLHADDVAALGKDIPDSSGKA